MLQVGVGKQGLVNLFHIRSKWGTAEVEGRDCIHVVEQYFWQVSAAEVI